MMNADGVGRIHCALAGDAAVAFTGAPDMSDPPATVTTAPCSRCHRAGGARVQSPFTAELLCEACLQLETSLLTRLRSARGGHLAVACEHEVDPRDPAHVRRAS
jgi:hypothetical protein